MTDLERFGLGVSVIVGMTSIIPLAIWALSGSWREGLHAWLQWAKIMGALTLIGAVLAGITVI